MEIPCPHCGKMVRFEFTCNRCQHRWTPRTEEEPSTCPKCKSPYWNKDRVRKVKKISANKASK